MNNCDNFIQCLEQSETVTPLPAPPGVEISSEVGRQNGGLEGGGPVHENVSAYDNPRVDGIMSEKKI